jgi:hypothetical protein
MMTARDICEICGWIWPARRLAWGPVAIDAATRQQTMDEFGAAVAAADVYLPGADDDDEPVQFAPWIDRRFNRPALPDSVVKSVGSSIVNTIRELREVGDPAIDVLNDITDIRIGQLLGDPPYDVQLLFVTRDADTSNDVRLALARLIVDMQSWLTPQARIVAWDAASINENLGW